LISKASYAILSPKEKRAENELLRAHRARRSEKQRQIIFASSEKKRLEELALNKIKMISAKRSLYYANLPDQTRETWLKNHRDRQRNLSPEKKEAARLKRNARLKRLRLERAPLALST